MKPPVLLCILAAVAAALASPAGAATRHLSDRGGGRDDQVVVFGASRVESDETVVGDNVTVFGNAQVDGHVTHDTVTVFGSCVVNGRVDHDVVVAMGDLTLGPDAHIEHDVVCVGVLHRDPGAYIGGHLENQHIGLAVVPLAHFHDWWAAGLHRGQYLTFGPHLSWLWALNISLLFSYALVALIAPAQVRRSGDMIVTHPATVFLAAMLAIIALPFVFLLLCITIVGIPVALLLLPAAVILLTFFGHASLYALVGRRLFGEGLAPGAAVLAGGAVCFLVLLLPIIGALASFIIWFVAWGCACAALFSGRRTAPVVAAAGTPIVPPPPAPPPVTPSPFAPPPPAPDAAPPPPEYSAPVPPPPVAAHADPLPSVASAVLPRAGFWIRAAGLAIDLCLVGVICGIVSDMRLFHLVFRGEGPCPFLIVCAIYAAVMWKLRGATIGGLICHLSVVRLDGRPVDWTTAIVRVLGCFVSLIAVGLGFIWVAFDPERQSWHDKIAGTTVVIPARRQSLV